MGYYITLEEANFRIPETEQVLNVLKDLNKRDDLKTGGSWENGKQTRVWFAWMPEDYDKTVKSVAQVFDLLGFETNTEDYDGEYVGLTYYNSKAGSEDIFIEAVAPFVEDGCYLEWRGEEGERWRQVVRQGKIHTQSATTVWSD
jgi:hypothetical protein